MSNHFSVNSLKKIAYDNNIPLSVTIELLTECNLRCKHCYIPEHDDMGLGTETIIKLLYDLREVGTLSVIFTGGEIFLREDIFEIIETARRLHFRVFLLSNATLLNEDKISRLASLHISEFSASVYSLNSSIHDSITGVPGSLEDTLNNLLLMKKYNIPTKLKTPLMKDNCFCYKELGEFCNKNNFEHEVSPIITSKNNCDTSTHSLRVSESDLLNIISDLDNVEREREEKRKIPVPVFGLHDEICSIIYYNFYIDCKGEAYPCNSFFYRIGSIFDSSISDIWNNSQQLKELKKMKRKDLHKCNECSLINVCKRCPGLALLEDNALMGCSTVDKTLATVRHKILSLEGR